MQLVLVIHHRTGKKACVARLAAGNAAEVSREARAPLLFGFFFFSESSVLAEKSQNSVRARKIETRQAVSEQGRSREGARSRWLPRRPRIPPVLMRVWSRRTLGWVGELLMPDN